VNGGRCHRRQRELIETQTSVSILARHGEAVVLLVVDIGLGGPDRVEEGV
jgi:hypothetical protein